MGARRGKISAAVFAAVVLAGSWPAAGLSQAGTDPAATAQCPERPPCRGCGCRGGPGYRGPDGRCVGFRELAKICGTPPERRCVFENAPGTGANRECALAPRAKKK